MVTQKTPKSNPPKHPAVTLPSSDYKNSRNGQFEHLFDVLLENNPVAIAILDTNGLVTLCNPAFEKLFGYSVSELQGKPIDPLISNIDTYQENLEYTHRTAHGEAIRMSGYRWRRDGTPVYVEIQGAPITVAGQQTGMLTLYHDITAFKAAEETLHEMNLSFERIMNGIDADIYVSDIENHQILFANQHLLKSFGTDLVGKICYQYFRGLNAPCTHCTNSQLLDSYGAPNEPVVWEGWNPITHRWYKNSDCAIRWKDGRYVRLQIATDISELKKAQQNLTHIATHDALTGLPNRVLFFDRMEHAIAVANRNSTNLAVFFLDLDKFKSINDNFGHHIGDLVLQEVAQRMNICLRESDTLARISGDEFTFLFEQIAYPEIVRVAERVIQSLRPPFFFEGHTVQLSASVGISQFPKDGSDSDSIIQHADHAMYMVKNNGGNGFGF